MKLENSKDSEILQNVTDMCIYTDACSTTSISDSTLTSTESYVLIADNQAIRTDTDTSSTNVSSLSSSVDQKKFNQDHVLLLNGLDDDTDTHVKIGDDYIQTELKRFHEVNFLNVLFFNCW